MPGNARHILVLALESGNLSHHPDIKHLNGLITRTSEQPISVAIPFHFGDSIGVASERREAIPFTRIPQSCRVVLAPRSNQ